MPSRPPLRILYLEPFESGSHAAFSRTLLGGIEASWTVVTLPGRHWKWRVRGFVPWLALDRPGDLAGPFDLVLAGSFVNLAELVGLAPHLADVPRLLYFHENQLAFPVREEFSGERDLHFGFTQLVSALAATRCVFNSAWNRDSFLAAARELLARMPDAVPGGWVERIASCSEVLPLPLDLPDHPACARGDEPPGGERAEGPIILWNHRWEHDKAPAAFFAALARLAERGVPFRVAVCGRGFRQVPPEFDEARARFGPRVVHFGFVESAGDYFDLLGRCHLAVSTARHEFFGVAMLEAAHLGARPLVPDRLAYRETFPAELRYAPDEELAGELERLCRGWTSGEIGLRGDRRVLTAPYRAETVLPRYRALFEELARPHARA